MFYDNKNLSFKIRGIFSVDRKPRVTDSFNRTHTAISYRIKGKSFITSGTETILADSGSVSFFPAGVDFNRKTETDESLIILHLDAYGEAPNSIEAVPECEFLEADFRRLIELWESGGECAYNRCMSLFYDILDRLQGAKRSEKNKTADFALSYLQKNFKDCEISVQKLAVECSVSEVYLRKLFRKRYGVSPLEMLLKLRFEYARSLLSSGYYTPKESALMSGFTDIKYFREAFKKRYAISPSEFSKGEKKAKST